MGFNVVFNTLQTTCKAYIREASAFPYCTIIKCKGKGIHKHFTRYISTSLSSDPGSGELATQNAALQAF